MKFLRRILFISCLLVLASCQAQKTRVNLWKGEIPNSIENSDYKEVKEYKDLVLKRTSRVSVPTVTIFKPKQPNGTSIVILPGGGYSHLAINKEGYKVAEWFNSLGITAIVLKYRLPSDAIMKDRTIGPLQDAQEAMRFVRRNAKKWQLNNDKIGVIGFSAGGHLAATLSTQYNTEVYKKDDSISARPDFSLLIYPVISMKDGVTHNGSRTNLLGDSPSEVLINSYSNELQVNSQTPPTFLIHATDDGAVPIENSINYYMALKNNNVPVELHVYEKGGHGFGLGVSETSKNWTKQCEQWLHSNHYLD